MATPPAAAPNPIAALFHSRKFLLALADTVAAIAAHFVAEYAGAQAVADTNFLIVTLQPVIIAVIVAIAYEDAHP